MDNEESPRSRNVRILDLTLEILALLTGEEYVVIEKRFMMSVLPSTHPLVTGGRSSSLIVEPPPEMKNKIVRATEKIFGLQTVEEQHCGEGHGDIMMEDLRHPDFPSQVSHMAAASSSPEEPTTTQTVDMVGVSSCIKEELLPQPDSCRESCPAQKMSSQVKEYGVGDTNLDHPAWRSAAIKEESASAGEEELFIPPHPAQLQPTDIKEETVVLDVLQGECISVIKKGELTLCDEEYPPPSSQQTWMENPSSGSPSEQAAHYTCMEVLPAQLVVIEGSPCSTSRGRFAQHSQVTTPEKVQSVDKQYDCSECRKSFTNGWRLAQHQRTHSGDKPHVCSQCGKSFSNGYQLVRHHRVHTGDKPYSCSQCDKCFSNNSHLVIHRRVHTGDKPYSCGQCGKSFSTKANLDRHKRVHTGEKPFHCPVCRRSFAQKSAMIKHERIHTGERPYPCDRCGKGFVVKSELVKHRRTHTGEEP